MKFSARSLRAAASLGMLTLALAACQGEKKATPTGGTAQGEILPGSASDAMLPLDTVRSQPPLAPHVVATGKAGKSAAGEASASGTEAAPEAEAAAAPTISAETVD